ncbi:MAG: glycosyltransferase family 1 protein [Chloroflexi bacterium]|nr:glycosyltransferase family 1 protein [Chloroflexota bacterium]
MSANRDVVCLSHLRWDFVYQRPQHLLSRYARGTRVFFVEEPIALRAGDGRARLDISEPTAQLKVVVPRLPDRLSDMARDEVQCALLQQLLVDCAIDDFVLWYYTPMAVGFTRNLPPPAAAVYDCMDQLSAFRGAPPELLLREAELFQRVDLVFTGGQTLYEAKRSHHPYVYAFPSAVDVEHFAQARAPQADPADQATLPHPRLGFCGVLDERLDTELLARVADMRSDWQLVLIGPVVKIDPASLPRRPNIHYLGPKNYGELPRYLAGWDVALIPFARNDSTHFISPTKTPEYLAAGRPVVSTSIRDVLRPYRDERLVWIGDTAEEFIAATETAMHENPSERQRRADRFLAGMSWDKMWSNMDRLVDEAIARRAVGAGQAAVRAA